MQPEHKIFIASYSHHYQLGTSIEISPLKLAFIILVEICIEGMLPYRSHQRFGVFQSHRLELIELFV